MWLKFEFVLQKYVFVPRDVKEESIGLVCVQKDSDTKQGQIPAPKIYVQGVMCLIRRNCFTS